LNHNESTAPGVGTPGGGWSSVQKHSNSDGTTSIAAGQVLKQRDYTDPAPRCNTDHDEPAAVSGSAAGRSKVPYLRLAESTADEPGHGLTPPIRHHWAQHDQDTQSTTPKLRIDAGECNLERVSTQAWTAIERLNDPPSLFRHSERLVRLEPGTSEGSRLPVLKALNHSLLRYEAARAATWYRREGDGRNTREDEVIPPLSVIQDMLAYPITRVPLPILEHIVETPVFAPNGTLQASPGYHVSGQVLICLDEGLDIPSVPPSPTAADVQRALKLIDDLIHDFPFVGDADRTHAVALLLLPFVRDLIQGPTPLHLIEAPSPGTGKSLLARALLMPSSGERIGAMTYGRDEDETRKRIVTALLEARPAILIDNVNQTLDSAALSSALTEPVFSDRLLGTNGMLNLPVRCAWMATGNNPTLSTEIARRSIRIRLDASVDRPWQRDVDGFRHPALLAWATEHRGELIWAALVLAQRWIVAGRPPARGRSLGSYESWSTVIGGILAHAGVPGFLENLDELYERADSEGTVWRRFVEAWWEAHHDSTVGVADLYNLAEATEGFELSGGNERARRTSLGKALRNREDAVVGRYRIRKAGRLQRATQWQLERVSPDGA